MEKRDITSLEDVQLMVDKFYERVMADDVLGSIFEEHLSLHLNEHLEKMYTFWQTLLLGTHTYNGRPFPPHMKLPIGTQHFDRWLFLFEGVIDENFHGPKAEEAKHRANTIAGVFEAKLENMRSGQPF